MSECKRPPSHHKLIIGYGKTKREIEGPFQICGHGDWLAEIGRQLIEQSEGKYYGWCDITIRMNGESMVNNTPIPWEAKGE